MYVILGCYFKCNFGLMAKFIISFYSYNPTDEYPIYIIPSILFTNKATGAIYAVK